MFFIAQKSGCEEAFRMNLSPPHTELSRACTTADAFRSDSPHVEIHSLSFGSFVHSCYSLRIIRLLLCYIWNILGILHILHTTLLYVSIAYMHAVDCCSLALTSIVCLFDIVALLLPRNLCIRAHIVIYSNTGVLWHLVVVAAAHSITIKSSDNEHIY